MSRTSLERDTALQSINDTLAAASRKTRRIVAAANQPEKPARPTDYVELSEQTMTAGQVEQFEKVQAILAQVIAEWLHDEAERRSKTEYTEKEIAEWAARIGNIN